MLTSNIVKENTVIDLFYIARETFSVFLNKETGYLSILGARNPITGKLSSIYSINISKEFNQPIIIPDNLFFLQIDGKFNQSIILPDSLKHLRISGKFNHPIILPNTIECLVINGKYNQPIILPKHINNITLDGECILYNINIYLV